MQSHNRECTAEGLARLNWSVSILPRLAVGGDASLVSALGRVALRESSEREPQERAIHGSKRQNGNAEGGVPYLTSLILFRIDFSSVRVVSLITEIGITGLPIALRADNLVCNSSTETMSLLLKKIYSVFSASLAL